MKARSLEAEHEMMEENKEISMDDEPSEGEFVISRTMAASDVDARMPPTEG